MTDTCTITIATPLGPAILSATGGALSTLHLGVPGQTNAVSELNAGTAAVLTDTARQLAEYFAGRRTAFDLPLAPAGTPFQRDVWRSLREIPYGETVSYGELAGQLGRPRASRAVGAANGRNPLAVVVPCHRVIGAGGALTGYAGGLDRKRELLALEVRASTSRRACEAGRRSCR